MLRLMKEAEVRIEADGAEGGETILRQQGIRKGKQGVDRVSRRAAVAVREIDARIDQ